MPKAYLHGNHDPCPACEIRRAVQDTTRIIRDDIPCNACGGTGHIPLTRAEIIRRTCIEARRSYWPQFEERIASHG